MRVAASRYSSALVLLAVLVAAVALSATFASAAAQHAAPVKHALMVSIPLPGHLNPLIAQGMELRRRGWAVILASPSRLRKHIEAAKTRAAKESNGPNGAALLPLQSLDLGDCAAIAELTATLERAAGHEDYMASAREMLEWSLSLHHCMYKGLYDQLVHLSPAARPSVIVADFATYAAFDIADRFGLPLVINNPDLLNTLSPDDVAPYDFIPGTMTGTSLAEHASEDRWYGLVERALYPPLRVLLRYMAAALFESELHRQQSLAGVVPTPFFSRMSGRLLLVNGAFGLEYARPLPPNVIMVGHMSEKPWRNDVHQARKEYEEELSEEDRTWLESPVVAPSSATIASTDAASLDGSNVPVIWVSMGTISPLNERQVLAMYSAFERGTRAGHFRVLWKLERRDHAFLPPVSARPSPDQLRLVDWVSSQLGVLAHPATQLFISHCGINSVHESVYLEKGLLCIPILADQADMAVRVKDAHVGVHLSKSAFTGDELLENLLALLRPANSSALTGALRRTRHAMLLSGGVERASNFIEYAAQFGVRALVPIDVSHPWWVRHHLDMYAVWTMLLLFSAVAVHTCCCRLRPGKQCVESRKDMRAKGKAHAKTTAANAAQQSKQD